MNEGNWNGKQLLPKSYFEQYMKPQVSIDLPYGRGHDVFGKLSSDIIITVGWGINSVMIPSQGLVLVYVVNTNWDHPYLTPEDPDFLNYRIIQLLVDSKIIKKHRGGYE